MDHFLRPNKIEVLPEESDAAKVFDHCWLQTFNTFLEAISAAAENAYDVIDILSTAQNLFFHCRCYHYQEARNSLTNVYHMRKNIVFARHLLMTQTQSPTETVEEFVHVLRQLARDGEFQT